MCVSMCIIAAAVNTVLCVSAPIMIVAVAQRRGRQRREDEGEVNERREGREVAKGRENNKNRRQNGCQERENEAEMRWKLTPHPYPPKTSFSHWQNSH